MRAQRTTNKEEAVKMVKVMVVKAVMMGPGLQFSKIDVDARAWFGQASMALINLA